MSRTNHILVGVLILAVVLSLITPAYGQTRPTAAQRLRSALRNLRAQVAPPPPPPMMTPPPMSAPAPMPMPPSGGSMGSMPPMPSGGSMPSGGMPPMSGDMSHMTPPAGMTGTTGSMPGGTTGTMPGGTTGTMPGGTMGSMAPCGPNVQPTAQNPCMPSGGAMPGSPGGTTGGMMGGDPFERCMREIHDERQCKATTSGQTGGMPFPGGGTGGSFPGGQMGGMSGGMMGGPGMGGQGMTPEMMEKMKSMGGQGMGGMMGGPGMGGQGMTPEMMEKMKSMGGQGMGGMMGGPGMGGMEGGMPGMGGPGMMGGMGGPGMMGGGEMHMFGGNEGMMGMMSDDRRQQMFSQVKNRMEPAKRMIANLKKRLGDTPCEAINEVEAFMANVEEDPESAMEGMGSDMMDGVNKCMMVAEMSKQSKQITRHVDKQLLGVEKELSGLEKQAGKVGLESEALQAIRTAVTEIKQAVTEAKELLKTDPEEAMTVINDKVFGGIAEVREAIGDFRRVLQSIKGIKGFTRQVDRDLKAMNNQIRVLERQDTDVEKLKEEAAGLKTLADQIKAAAAERPFDPDKVDDLMVQFFDTKRDLEEAIMFLKTGDSGDGNDELNEFKKFMPGFQEINLFGQ